MSQIPESLPVRDANESALGHDPAIAEAAAEWFARRDVGLDPGQQQALQNWLAADPRHGAALARLDSAWSAFGRATRTGRADDLLHELAARAGRRRRRRAWAAAAVLMVALTVVAFWRSPRSDESPRLSPGTATLLVPAKRTLPDGSVVILKDGAQIAVAFTDALRRVELKQGQALFEVAKDPARPFVVSAGGVEVRAVGTAFSIQLGRKEVEILVTEGTVAVAQEATAGDRRLPPAGASGPPGNATVKPAPPSPTEGKPEAAADVRVNAGNRIVIEIAPTAALPPQVLPVAAAALDEWLAWRHLRVEFSGTPLAEAVALLNRHTADRPGLRLVLDDPALGSMRVSGVFRIDNTDAFVLLLEAGFGVAAERAGGTVRLHKAPAPAKISADGGKLR